MIDLEDDFEHRKKGKPPSKPKDKKVGDACSIPELLDWENLVLHINCWKEILDLSAQKLADKSGLSKPTVLKLLHGNTSITIGNVQKVLKALEEYKEKS